ncbi:MAG: hypothetical protein KY455_01925 [Euryarchaeota archaeon]|nr:hypothetical protein [Euryarchaeota archaeon]
MQVELVHMAVFDVGSELELDRVATVLGQAPVRAPLVARSPLPTYAGILSPLETVIETTVEVTRPDGSVYTVAGRVESRVHAVGVVAIRLRTMVEHEGIDGLGRLAAGLRIDGRPFISAAEAWMASIRPELAAARVEPYEVHVPPEPYLVFAIPGSGAEPTRLLEQEQGPLTALLMGDPSGSRISTRLIDHVLRAPLQYDVDDLVLVGPEATVVVSPREPYEDVLDVLEFANLELLELRTYDAYLDRRLDLALPTLSRLQRPGGVFRSARGVLTELSETRLDFARLTENLRDTGKLFGDWYLGRLHRIASERFHLEEWARAVTAKMQTLNDILHLAEEAVDHRRAVILESMIVLLFVLDLVLIFMVA